MVSMLERFGNALHELAYAMEMEFVVFKHKCIAYVHSSSCSYFHPGILSVDRGTIIDAPPHTVVM